MKKKWLLISGLGITTAIGALTPLISCGNSDKDAQKYCTITFNGGEGVIIPSNLPTLSSKQGTTLADYILSAGSPKIEIENWYQFDGYYINNQKVNPETYKFESDAVTIDVRAIPCDKHSVALVKKAIDETLVSSINVELKDESGKQPIPQPVPGEISFSKTNATNGFQMITTINLTDAGVSAIDNINFEIDSIYLQNSTDESNYSTLIPTIDYTITKTKSTTDKNMVITVTFVGGKATRDVRANLFVTRSTDIVMDAYVSEYVWKFNPAMVNTETPWSDKKVTVMPDYASMSLGDGVSLDFNGLDIWLVGFETEDRAQPTQTKLTGYKDPDTIPTDADFTYTFNGQEGLAKAIIVTFTDAGWTKIVNAFKYYNEKDQKRGSCYLEYIPSNETQHAPGTPQGATNPWEQIIHPGYDGCEFIMKPNPFDLVGFSIDFEYSAYDNLNGINRNKGMTNKILSLAHEKIYFMSDNKTTNIGEFCEFTFEYLQKGVYVPVPLNAIVWERGESIIVSGGQPYTRHEPASFYLNTTCTVGGSKFWEDNKQYTLRASVYYSPDSGTKNTSSNVLHYIGTIVLPTFTFKLRQTTAA